MQKRLPTHLAQFWNTQPGGIDIVTPLYVFAAVNAAEREHFSFGRHGSGMEVDGARKDALFDERPLHGGKFEAPEVVEDQVAVVAARHKDVDVGHGVDLDRAVAPTWWRNSGREFRHR